MARTKNPHRAALKSWETRRGSGPTQVRKDWARVPPDLGGSLTMYFGPKTDRAIKAVDDYQNVADRGAAQRALRSGRPLSDEQKEHVAALDAVVAGSRLSHPATVYRAISRARADREFVLGSEVEDKGFMSTSRTREGAEDFAATRGRRDEVLLVRVVLPKGIHALDVNAFRQATGGASALSEWGWQEEIVLQRGVRFVVEQDRDGLIFRVGKADGTD
jgi:hypothetical protein